MKSLLIILAFLSLQTGTDLLQDNTSSLLKKLNDIDKKYCRSYKEGMKIFYNQDIMVLDYHGDRIPLMEATFEYYSIQNEQTKGELIQMLKIECKQLGKNCVKEEDGNEISGVTVFYESKQAIYDFIEIIDKLRRID